MFDEIIEMLNSTTMEEQMRNAVKAAQEKYKPLHDWRKTHTKNPKNLMEAVMQRESYKAAYEKVYGAGSYDAL